MARVNNSVLWDFFEKTNNVDKKAKCKLCLDLYSYKASTGNLKSHLKKKHPDAYRRVVTAQHRQNAERPLEAFACSTSAATVDVPLCLPTTTPVTTTVNSDSLSLVASTSICTSASAIGRVQQTMDRYGSAKKISKEVKQKIDNDLLRLFIKGYQPFSLVEEENFRRYSSWIPGYTLPTRKSVSNEMIPALYDKTKEKVKIELSKSAVENVCLTGDLWTSRANESYLAVTGHYVTDDFSIKSILLDCSSFPQSHTSEHIQAALGEMVSKWDLQNKINFMVTDNAPNITKAVRDMGWKHYGCYAHSLNLIVQETLKTIENILDKVKKIVRYFKNSTTAQAKLLKAQINEDANCIPKRLKQEVPTRWNSAYYMLQRFVNLEPYVRATIATLRQDLPIMSNEEWTFCAELCQILKPFDDATTSLSGQNYMTASSVIVMTRCLVSGCDKLLEETFCEASKNVTLKLRSGLLTRFTNVERSGTFSVCTFLDPRYKIAVFADANEAKNTRKRVQDMLEDTIAIDFRLTSNTQPSTSTSTQNHDKFSPWSVLQDIMSQQQNVGTPLSKAVKEIDTYLNEDILPVFRADGSWNCPMEWWRNHKYTYPYLSKMVKKYCNIMATSVPCERVFSKAGLIISDRRTRLTSSKVEQLTFLNINL